MNRTPFLCLYLQTVKIMILSSACIFGIEKVAFMMSSSLIDMLFKDQVLNHWIWFSGML